jgi:hypothetical protein
MAFRFYRKILHFGFVVQLFNNRALPTSQVVANYRLDIGEAKAKLMFDTHAIINQMFRGGDTCLTDKTNSGFPRRSCETQAFILPINA